MKSLFLTLIAILLLIPVAGPHGIEKGSVNMSTDSLNIQFSTVPKFPVTGKVTSMDFVIEDKKGNLLSGLNAKLELHKQKEVITLDLIENQKGGYRREYSFNKAGEYEIHLTFGDLHPEIEFDLAVDSFGLSGVLRSGIIALLLLIFVTLMLYDLKQGKS